MSVIFFYDTTEPAPFLYLTPTRQVGPLAVPYATSLSPNGYVEFAVEDVAVDTPRGLINAFSNVKRAIHLLIDSLMNQYGLFFHFQYANFPAKLQVLDQIGLLPISIMQNLNVERNLLEHEYSVPTKQRVREAVDVVKLLLMATEKLIEATPHEAVVGWKSPRRNLLLRLEPQRGKIDLFGIWASGHRRRLNGVSCISGIRKFDGGLYPWVRVAKRPWRTIQLDRTNTTTWQPIVKELVNAQRRSLWPRVFVAPQSASVSMTVTVPIALPDAVSWNDLLDRAQEERVAEEESLNADARQNGNAGSMNNPDAATAAGSPANA